MPRGRGRGPQMSNEKAKDFKGTMKKLMAYLSAYKIGIFFVIVFAIGSTIFNIVGPKILGKATTEIFKGLVRKVSGGSGIDFDKIAHIVLTLLCLYLTSAVFSFVQGYIMTGVSQKLTYRLRKEISEKINRLPMNYFDKQTHGEVLSRITNDVDTLSQSLNQSATQVITSTTTIIGVLIMMLSISPLMTVVALLILPVSMGLISVIVKRSQKYFMSQQEYLGHVNGQVEEIYGGHNIIKAFNKEEDVIATFKRDNDILYTSAWKSQFLSGMMMPIMQFVGNLGYVGEVILGGYLAMKGTIQVGDIQSFIQYVRSFTMPIQQVAQVANMLQSTAAASERVFEFLEEKEEDQTVENPVCIDKLEGSVSFDHVHFGYNPDHTIINDFSVDVKPGQKVAIVGPTGAGKTTIINLLSIEEREGKSFLAKYFAQYWESEGLHVRIVNHDIDFEKESKSYVQAQQLSDFWQLNDAEQQPDIILVEYPALCHYDVPEKVLAESDFNLLVANAARLWSEKDNARLRSVKDILKDKSLYLYLNNADRETVESFTGELPPHNSVHSFFRRLAQLGLTSQKAAVK